MKCMNCKKEETTNKYRFQKHDEIYELELCPVCNNLFRQELIKAVDKVALLERYGAAKRPTRRGENLAIGGVICCDYGFKKKRGR